MADVFTLTITRPPRPGERVDQERQTIVQALTMVAGNLGNGSPLKTSITDASGATIGACSWGPDAVNQG